MSGYEPHRLRSIATPAPDGDSDAARVAEAAAASWREIHRALMPVIGPAGFGALYQRSLHVAGAPYPALAAVAETAGAPGDTARLQAALAQQSGAAALAASAALLQVFRDLLASLIGASLSDRILAPAGLGPSPAAPGVQ